MKYFIFLFLVLHSTGSGAQEAASTEEVELHCKAQSQTAETLSIQCNENQRGHFNLVLQTGEFAGMVSPGVSLQFHRHQITLLGGYFPEAINGDRLWEANLKYEFHPIRDIGLTFKNGESLWFSPLYFGAGIIYGIHKNLFVKQPPQYPRGYYSPTAIRYTFNVGTSATFRKVSVYVDYSALDVGLISMAGNFKFYRENYAAFGLGFIGTVGMGIKYNLGRRH